MTHWQNIVTSLDRLDNRLNLRLRQLKQPARLGSTPRGNLKLVKQCLGNEEKQVTNPITDG